jgi:hypothetical protein
VGGNLCQVMAGLTNLSNIRRPSVFRTVALGWLSSLKIPFGTITKVLQQVEQPNHILDNLPFQQGHQKKLAHNAQHGAGSVALNVIFPVSSSW